ncbi:MAG: hypothetical protein JWP02_645 [Acidimicrobiales bacterium]|nr:hypothetical protein [Acidimicrobiales bacterium]
MEQTLTPPPDLEDEPDPKGSPFDPIMRWKNVLVPFPRAGLFYVRSWENWLKHRGEDGVPAVRPTLLMMGHALADEAVIAGFRVVKPPAPTSWLVRAEREAGAAIELYDERGWLADPATFYPEPPVLERPTTRWERTRKLRYSRLSYESRYEPFPDEPGRDRWLSYKSNRRARAWVLQHPEPRPWLVCVHGTSMGKANMDLALFRARWLHHELGLNVALPVLPLHGPRGDALPPHAAFPGEDVMDNIHGIAQSVWDVRRLVRWAQAQGDMPVGITGVSLGGFVTALVAGLEDDLACAILGVPAVDLIDLIEHHSPRGGDEQYQRMLVLARQLGTVVSPLSLVPRLPVERRFVYAGLADRLAHPRHQVGRLWEHWDRPSVLWYKGGHVAFSRSKEVGRFVRRALESSGLTSPAAAGSTG